MHTKIRLISVTPLQEFTQKTVDGLDFSTVENSGEIEIVAEITNDEKSELVSKVVVDFDIFEQELETFENE